MSDCDLEPVRVLTGLKRIYKNANLKVLTKEFSLRPVKVQANVVFILLEGECVRFCERCGSRMKRVKKGIICLKCDNIVHAEIGFTEVTNITLAEPNPIYVVEDLREQAPRVSRMCPRCGYDQAFHWFSSVSGEHAGVKQERTLEHLRCTRCQHSWAETR